MKVFSTLFVVASVICIDVLQLVQVVGAEHYETSFGIRTDYVVENPNHDYNFGQSVSISRDGKYTVVGAPNLEENGRVCVYDHEKMKSGGGDECLELWDEWRVGRRDGVAISGDAKIIAVSNFNFRPRKRKDPWRLSKIRVFVREESDSDEGVWFKSLGDDITSSCLEKEVNGETKSMGCMKILPKSLAISADGSTLAIMFADQQKKRNRYVVRAYKFNGKKWVYRGNAIKLNGYGFGDIAERFQFPRLSLSANGRVIAIGLEHTVQTMDSQQYSYGTVYVLDVFGVWKRRREFVDLHDNQIRFPMIQISDDGLTVAIGGDDVGGDDFNEEEASGEAFGVVKIYRFMNNGPFTKKVWRAIGEPFFFQTKNDKPLNGWDPMDASQRSYAFFSMDLSGDGNTIAIGAPHLVDEYDSTKGGMVNVYRFNEENNLWDQKVVINEVNFEVKESKLFGMDVSLSYDGSKLAAGIPGFMRANNKRDEDHDWDKDHDEDHDWDEDHDEDHDWDEDHDKDEDDDSFFYGYFDQNREGRVRVFELRNEFTAPYETAVE